MSNELMNTISHKLDSVFDFEVEKRPLSGPAGEPTPFFGLFRTDTNSTVGYAPRDGYVPHTRDDLKVMTYAGAVALGGDVDVRAWWGVDMHHIEIRKRGLIKDMAHDKVAQVMFIEAGYHGTAYKSSLGYWRKVCSNGMVALVPGTAARIWHTTNMRSSIDEITTQLHDLRGNWQNIEQVFESFTSARTRLSTYLAQVYPEPKTDRAKASYENRIEKIVRRVNSEREKLGHMPSSEFSLWECFNAVQGYCQWEKSRRNAGDSDLGRAIATHRDPDVVRAWQIASSMAS